jgi:hypothetical protein
VKSWTQSQSCKNWPIPIQDRPTHIATQLLLSNASATVYLVWVLGGTLAKTSGARFSTEHPCNHLSFQKTILFPFPSADSNGKKASELGCEGSLRSVQGRLVPVFLCYYHLACKAQAMTSRLMIPNPPRSKDNNLHSLVLSLSIESLTGFYL